MAPRPSVYSGESSVDKGWAWMVLLGANLWNLTVSGTLKSFGVLYVELMVVFNSGPAETGWVGFVFCTMMLVLSPFSGYLGDKVSSRWIMIIGGVVAAWGVFLTGFVPSLPWAIVTYGIVAGGAVGIMDGPVFSTLNKYFKKRRAFANSVAFTGSGVGCLVVPLLIRVCVEHYTLRGTMFVLGGLWLHSLVIGALFRPIQLQGMEMQVSTVQKLNEEFDEIPRNDINVTHSNLKEDLRTIENSRNQDGCIEITDLSCSETNSMDHTKYDSVSKTSSLQEHKTDHDIQRKTQSLKTYGPIMECTQTGKPRSKLSVVGLALKDYWHFLCNIEMLRIVLAIMFGSTAYFNQIFLFPPLAEELGISKFWGALLVSLTGIAEMTSRIPLGLLCDKPFINKPLLVSVLSIVSCAIAFIVSFIPTREILLSYACVIGILGGTIIPLAMPLLADVVPTARIGSAAGLFLWGMGMAYAVGPPVLGAVKVYSGSYVHSFQLAVSMYIPTAFFLLWGVVHKCLKRRNLSDSTDVESKSQNVKEAKA